MSKRRIRGYWPDNEGDDLKCKWLYCAAGCGIAGHGFCSLNGHWWLKSCPEFVPDWAFPYVGWSNMERNSCEYGGEC